MPACVHVLRAGRKAPQQKCAKTRAERPPRTGLAERSHAERGVAPAAKERRAHRLRHRRRLDCSFFTLIAKQDEVNEPQG